MAGFFDTVLTVENAINALAGSGAFSLGGVALFSNEVPQSLTIGGTMAANTDKLPGGGKRVALLGYFDDNLQWEGRFLGPSAVTRAQSLAALLRAGQVITFTGAGVSRQVVILAYSYDYQSRGAVVPYKISLEVIPVTTTPTAAGTTAGLASLIGDDAASAVSKVTGAVSTTANYVTSAAGTLATYAGNAVQLASLVGAGGALAQAQTILSGVSQTTSTLGGTLSATNINALANSFSQATGFLETTVSTTEGALSGIAGAATGVAPVADAGGLLAATAASGAQAASLGALAASTRAVANVSASGGTV